MILDLRLKEQDGLWAICQKEVYRAGFVLVCFVFGSEKWGPFGGLLENSPEDPWRDGMGKGQGWR